MNAKALQRLGLALIVPALFALASCGSDDDDGGSGTALTTEALDGRTFLSTNVTGQTLVDQSRITLSFEGDVVAAVAGCNTMTGGYTLDGSTLQVAALAQTRMACEADLQAQDTWIAELLQSGPELTLTDTELTMKGDDTTITFGDRETVANTYALDGSTWSIDSLEVNGTTMAAPDGAHIAYDDGTIFVATGCNRGFAPVEVVDGTVTIGLMGISLMACEPELMAWETALTTFLTGELQYEASGDDLTLTNATGTLTLHRIPNPD